MNGFKLSLDVEIEQKIDSQLSRPALESTFKQWLSQHRNLLITFLKQSNEQNEFIITDFTEEIDQDIGLINVSLSSSFEKTKILKASDQELSHLMEHCIFNYFIYKLNLNSVCQSDVDFENETPYFTLTLLPSFELQGLWESLFFNSLIKERLLNFFITSFLFADHKVNPKIVSINKIFLIHGPPGTGKTSLCKAFAHKLSIKMQHRFSFSQLIEINSHSLFSKWFSESGKMVLKLFSQIRDYCDNPACLLFLLIDEVESLVYARQNATGSDPSDSIRVVNALLTQIDSIKNYPNVIILSTSNITNAIDIAFVDRADIKQFIGLPSSEAIYEIYRSCLNELIRTGLLCDKENLLPIKVLLKNHELSDNSQNLYKLSKKSLSLSGRTLRKLPLLAFALLTDHKIPIKIENFLPLLEMTINKHFEDVNDLNLI